MMVTTLERMRVWTAADLLAMPDDLAHRYELVGGRLMRMPPTGGTHGRRSMDLGAHLALHVEQHGLGAVFGAETGFNLTRSGERRVTVLAPDVAFVRTENVPLTETDDFPRVAPDLAVEIASPSESRRRLAEKAQRYLDRGVRLVWVVWPRRRETDVWVPGSVAPRTLTATDSLDGEAVVPRFTMPVARVCPERSHKRRH
ncbi:MAG TPA: Uma2 family endonuclease [Chloroflexota bacterium]|jgi:Uma2 family endonuclease|nr:Uma2 family endonuclease [Chloroflexota bacterium]